MLDLKAARQAIGDRLKTGLNARINLSPALSGVISKTEVQCFYASSRYSQPVEQTFNAPFKNVQTLSFRINLQLRDLRDDTEVLALLPQVVALLTGYQVFGEQPLPAAYEGGMYPTSEQFNTFTSEAIWFYSLQMDCQVVNQLPIPNPK